MPYKGGYYMTEKEFDLKVMESLIALNRLVDNEIEEMGIDMAEAFMPELCARSKKIKGFLVNYGQHYFKGLAYAEYMNVDEIESVVQSSTQKKKCYPRKEK